MTLEKLNKIAASCALLPEPGAEVARELVGHIQELRSQLIDWQAAYIADEDSLGEQMKKTSLLLARE